MIAGILLSAGFGTRLKPITDEIPKPAIPFLDKPMVWYALNSMKHAGITNIAANVHHLPDKMTACLNDCADVLELPKPGIYREQNEILGTGGGARACMSLLPEADRFVIYHGDVLCGVDLADVIRAHIDSDCGISLVVAPRPEHSKLGMVGVDDQGYIGRIRDWYRAGCDTTTTFSPCCFTGIHVVERNVLEQLPKQQYVCLVTEIYPSLLAAGERIRAIETRSFFADVGTPETYLEAQRQILGNPQMLPGAVVNVPKSGDNTDFKPPVSVAEGIDVHDCTIGPNVCICRDAVVHPGERLCNEMRFGRYRIGL